MVAASPGLAHARRLCKGSRLNDPDTRCGDDDESASKAIILNFVQESREGSFRRFNRRRVHAQPDDPCMRTSRDRSLVREVLIEGDHDGAPVLCPCEYLVISPARQACCCSGHDDPSRTLSCKPWFYVRIDVLVQRI
jgi:hypothetical protein